MSNMKSLFGTIKKLQPGHDLLRTDRLITIGRPPLVHFLLAIVLSVLLRYTDSDYPFGIFKLLTQNNLVKYLSILILRFLDVVAVNYFDIHSS